jgi:hypothetical protein
MANATPDNETRHARSPHLNPLDETTSHSTSSLSDLKNRSENSAGRGQILPVLQANSRSIGQKSGEICTGQADFAADFL